MSQSAWEQIMSRFESDAAFRDALKADPVGTVQGAGITVTDDVRAMLEGIEPGISDEELQQRVSKGASFNPFRRS